MKQEEAVEDHINDKDERDEQLYGKNMKHIMN